MESLTYKETSLLMSTAHERNIKHREDSNGLNNVFPTFDHSDVKCGTRVSVLERFPHKLYAILSSGTFKNIITFSDDGKSWKVINKKLLEEEVLPEYFRTGKYLSFTRNVLGWGFQRNGKATYYHELFCRGQPDKLDDMIRISASKLKFMERKESEKKEKSESSRHFRNSSNHTILGAINSSRSNGPLVCIKQELEENIKYLNLTQQVLHSQDSVSPYPIYNNNYFANERSNSLHSMIPTVNLASNRYPEDINRPSTSSYHHQLYYEGIGLRDSKARMMMNRDRYIMPHNNLGTQDAIFGRSDMYQYLPHMMDVNKILDRGH